MGNPLLEYKRVRILFHADKFTNQQDILISATPCMYRGNDARFEVLIDWNSEIVDLSNLASLTFSIWNTARTSRKATKTLTAGDITAIPSSAGWIAGTAQHAAFPFTGQEMNWALTANTLEESFCIVLAGITNNSPARNITYGLSSLKIIEDAEGNAAEAVVNNPIYYTQPEADARFAQRHADGASWMLKDGQHPYRYVAATDLWHPEIVTEIDGKYVITLGQVGEAL